MFKAGIFLYLKNLNQPCLVLIKLIEKYIPNGRYIFVYFFYKFDQTKIHLTCVLVTVLFCSVVKGALCALVLHNRYVSALFSVSPLLIRLLKYVCDPALIRLNSVISLL